MSRLRDVTGSCAMLWAHGVGGEDRGWNLLALNFL